MEKNYWNEKWEKKEIGFHQDSGHPALPKYFEVLSGTKVLVPLCGKSKDMLWLAAHGFKVVGVELSPIACRDFFEEASLPFSLSQREGFTVFEGTDISLWCGDFFKLPQSAIAGMTTIYDRAALIALPPDTRKQYVV